MAPFYGWGSAALRLEPLRGGSLLFTTTTATWAVKKKITELNDRNSERRIQSWKERKKKKELWERKRV